MRIALIVLMLASLPPIVQAQQDCGRRAHCAAARRGNALLAAESPAFQRQSIRILDSSQLSVPAASFRLAGLQQTAGDGYLATVRCAELGGVSAVSGGVSLRSSRREPASIVRRRIRQPKRGTAVHTGDTARLEMTITGANLSFPVICLEEGDVGEMIRTRALATNRIFQAMVTGRRQLRGVERAQ